MTEAMGGSVIADASPMGGLRIVVELPAAAAAPAEAPGTSRAARAAPVSR
jgi:hypothetical protein